MNKKRIKINDISHFMKNRGISNVLQIRIFRYLEYMHEQEKLGAHRGKNLLNSLSENLQEELTIESYSKILKNFAVFKKNNFSKDFIDSLSLKMIEITFAPEEIVCKVINKI